MPSGRTLDHQLAISVEQILKRYLDDGRNGRPLPAEWRVAVNQILIRAEQDPVGTCDMHVPDDLADAICDDVREDVYNDLYAGFYVEQDDDNADRMMDDMQNEASDSASEVFSWLKNEPIGPPDMREVFKIREVSGDGPKLYNWLEVQAVLRSLDTMDLPEDTGAPGAWLEFRESLHDLLESMHGESHGPWPMKLPNDNKGKMSLAAAIMGHIKSYNYPDPHDSFKIDYRVEPYSVIDQLGLNDHQICFPEPPDFSEDEQ
jgi:hypothetical protein